MYKWYNTILPSIAIIFGSMNILCMLVMWGESDIYRNIAAILFTIVAIACYKESKIKAKGVKENGNIN